jgi:hypothetical protein
MMKLFVCIFDDARLLKHLLRHYVRFGITEFHVAAPSHLADYVSEVSQDYNVRQYNDFDVAESFTGGVEAVTRMRELSQKSDEWIVIVDLDEFVDFQESVADIIAKVEAENGNIVQGIMFDRFAIDGKPKQLDDYTDLPSLFPVKARFTRDVMGGVDIKGVLVKGHLKSCGAHHIFEGEKPYSKVLEIAHYKWTGSCLDRVMLAHEMCLAAGRGWAVQYKRILDHYQTRGRFAWETFGGEIVGINGHSVVSTG